DITDNTASKRDNGRLTRHAQFGEPIEESRHSREALGTFTFRNQGQRKPLAQLFPHCLEDSRLRNNEKRAG
ncbi:MAG TPA: hypothetical protein VFR18_21100, partial [Terriglobia bacterium]|nr:hypothetical protein [Terriglobia bacterium]